MTSQEDREGIAQRIPSMGGAELGPALRTLARLAPAGTAIVEVGAWMGAGTAQLALGILERDSPGEVSLHVFDRWRASKSERRKAARDRVTLAAGEDLLAIVRRTLQPLGLPIEYRQGELRDMSWNGPAISVYVDDAAKQPVEFLHVLRTFAPSWRAGSTTLVLMDFNHWRKIPWSRRWFYRTQDIIIRSHPECFRKKTDPRWMVKGSAALFEYTSPFDPQSVEQMWRIRLLVAAQRLIHDPARRGVESLRNLNVRARQMWDVFRGTACFLGRSSWPRKRDKRDSPPEPQAKER